MTKDANLKVAEWNETHPIGTPVTYYPLRTDAGRLHGEPEVTRTRSKAWWLGCGEAVVLVAGRSGGVSLDHLELRDAEPDEDLPVRRAQATPRELQFHEHLTNVIRMARDSVPPGDRPHRLAMLAKDVIFKAQDALNDCRPDDAATRKIASQLGKLRAGLEALDRSWRGRRRR